MAKETGWAIVGPHGLYTGWWQTRAEAIAGHMIGYHGGNSARTLGLTDAQRAEWRRMKKRGDRAVKITMTYR